MRRPKEHEPEVLVIGGGATGAGIARDLAMRGADVLLVEARDFSAGASGGNHGMLHSGARYAVRDPASAKECAEENLVLKKVAGYCIEDTGGLFVSVPADDQGFLDQFLVSCAANRVRAKEIGCSEARRAEPNLSPDITAAVEVNDASIDPFFLVWGNISSAREAGAAALNYTPLVSMTVKAGRIERAIVGRGKGRRTVRPEMVVNAAGAWSDQVAAMVGLKIDVQLDKGTMVVFNGRVVNRLVNRLRPPSDGDILVPHRTSTILGTTSGPGDLSNIGATREEVEGLLREAGQVLPGLDTARMVRAYAGVRPLLGGANAGRDATRTFRVIDHSEEGVDNMLSVVGGKLTTYRLMAERTSDVVMSKLGRSGHCRTMQEEISPLSFRKDEDFQEAVMRRKYGCYYESVLKERSSIPLGREEVCSCESVSRGELEHFAGSDDVKSSTDLMRRTRAGMGYCQGGLCAFRLASALGTDAPMAEAEKFLGERWRGIEPVLEGDQMRQEAFKAHLFSVYGIDHARRGRR